MTVTGRGGTETDTGRGTVLLVSVSEGVRRTTSLRQVSTFPPGNIISSSPPLRLILTILVQTLRVTGMRTIILNINRAK